MCCPHFQIGIFKNGKFSCQKPTDLQPSLNPPMWIPEFSGLGGMAVRDVDYSLHNDPDFTHCPENRKNPTGGFLDVRESDKTVR